MAWQFYDALEVTGCVRGRDIQGPLPCKRWIKSPHDKRHKLSYRWHYTAKGVDDADTYNERLARRYVEWLAKRDGLVIPPCPKSRIVWSGFYSATKTRNVRHYNGNRTQPAYCKRIQAIEWGRDEERYNTRKDGKQGAWSYNEFVAEFRIDIPHWDFEPTLPIEELLP